MPSENTVFVVDDDPSMRMMLSAVIEEAGYGVAAFESAEAFLAGHHSNHRGCMVLDLRLTGMSGLHLQEELVRRGWHMPIVFLSAFGTVDVVAQAMKAGAVYFLAKPIEREELLKQVEEAMTLGRKERYRSEKASELEERLATLTPRESVVLQLVVQGKTSRQIAQELFNSKKTIELHRWQIMRKLGAKSVAHLVRMIVSAGQDSPQK